MCGILGQISFDKLNKSLPNLSSLNHRGPDGYGEWINPNGNIYFGHTRLSILEPTPAGSQPMQDSTKRFTIIFNGEIYNHLGLRKLLPEVKWRGNSDTETLIEILAAKGLNALDLIKGMFAFALHDNFDDSVLLVRDRLGIKPLWYSKQKRYLRFSSEIRALVIPGNVKLLNQAIGEYIGFGRMPGDGEIFDGIQALSPGYWLKIQGSKEISQGKWWPKTNFPSFIVYSRSGVRDQIKQLVSDAIEEHLISDVGVGSFLSGGIDSSIVTLVAGKILGNKLQTFTVGFPQSKYDERVIARKVAIKAGTDHKEIEVNSDICLEWVKDAVFNLDLPSVDAINTYIVSKAVKNSGLKVALSGLGGDELFGGYPSFKTVPWLQLINNLPTGIIKRLIHLMPRKIKDKFGGLDSFSVLEVACAHRRFNSVSSLAKMGLISTSPNIPAPPSELDIMGKISWAEIYGYMIPMLLRDSDQMSMAVGLEIRVPFLDHHLVEKVLGLSQKIKSSNGLKPLLVSAFRDELPQEVYRRPKQGFVLPMDEWIRGSLSEFSIEGIRSAENILKMTEPMQQYKEFQKGNLHWTRIWNWCVLGHWLSNQMEVKKITLCPKQKDKFNFQNSLG